MKSSRKRRRLITFILLLLAGGEWWWHASQPKYFRVVAHYPLVDDKVLISRSGILTSERSGRKLRGWPHGDLFSNAQLEQILHTHTCWEYSDYYTNKPGVLGTIKTPADANPLVYSQNGQYLLTNTPIRYPAVVEWLDALLNRYFNMQFPQYAYELYAHPGIKQAVFLQSHGIFWYKQHIYVTESGKMLSPDGRTLAFIAREGQSNEKELFFLRY
jgi:hypothetical protein